ncbi:hypothetical protein IWX50DRAFT_288336 [Phyllosticta citricarpa]
MYIRALHTTTDSLPRLVQRARFRRHAHALVYPALPCHAMPCHVMSCTRQPERADTKDAPPDSSLSPTSTTNKTLPFSDRAPTPRCTATRRTATHRHDIEFSSPWTLRCLNLTTHSPAYPLQRRACASTDPPPPRAQRQLIGQERTALPVFFHDNLRTGSRSQRRIAVLVAGKQAGRLAPQASQQACTSLHTYVPTQVDTRVHTQRRRPSNKQTDRRIIRDDPSLRR